MTYSEAIKSAFKISRSHNFTEVIMTILFKRWENGNSTSKH